MTTETVFIVVTAVTAALVGLGALVAVLRGRGAVAHDADALVEPASLPQETGYEPMLRVAWWVVIAGVLVGIGISDAYPETRAGIYAVGGAAAGLVVLLHELLPRRWRTRPVVLVEIAAALALATALLLLTGHGASPFVFAYHLVAVAVALTLGSRLGLVTAAVASLAFAGVLALDPGRAAVTEADMLRMAINVGSLWLLAFVAGAYASGERRMRQRVLELSQIDALTGLYNRGQLHPTLEQEVQRTRRSGRGFCVVMVDLDGLKAINDSLGHLRGDDVLRGLGRVIRSCIRAVDSAYRYGGDEFIVLLPETEFIGAFVVAEKIREGVEEIGVSLASGEPEASVSIGLVSYPEDGATAEELLLAADRALYTAKSAGKNQISGNPRPRRTPHQLPVAVALPPEAEIQATADASFAPSPALGNGRTLEPHGDDEPDPATVRRQIAAARLNMDPDHQIRRAMDAFLSAPSRSEGD